MNEADILAYLKKMQQHGIGFHTGLPAGGMVDLSPDQIQYFMVDEDAFWARWYRVTKEHFVLWRRAWHGGAGMAQCAFVKKSKQRCGNYVEVPENPQLFPPSGNLYCRYHQL